MIESHSPSEQTPGPRHPGSPADKDRQREKLQKQLDEALADSFPASDPVSIVTSHEEEDWGQPERK